MDLVIKKPSVGGEVTAISSKAEIHRALICASLCEDETLIKCACDGDDNTRTAEALNALGARIRRTKEGFHVRPISGLKSNASIHCGDSASTLRFLLPVAAAIGTTCKFHMSPALAQRPIDELITELSNHGARVSKGNPIELDGGIFPGYYTIPGNISSQFASGLIISLCLAGGELEITGNIESRPYIDVTVDVLRKFGAAIDIDDNKYKVHRSFPFTSPEEYTVEGDWSEAAVFLAIGVLGDGPVTVNGINRYSKQGDSVIVDILQQMGATLEINENSVTAFPSKLHAIDINAQNFPDIVPVLSVLACAAEGTSIFRGVDRLKLKESDRILSIEKLISGFGGQVQTGSGVIEVTKSKLTGGAVDTYNDHRIAMSAAVAAVIAENPVTITNPECVSKSHSGFWNEYKKVAKW